MEYKRVRMELKRVEVEVGDEDGKYPFFRGK